MARFADHIRTVEVWAVLCVLICLCGEAFGQTVPGEAKVVSPGGYEALAAGAGKTGWHRVIVRIDAPFTPMGDPGAPQSVAQMRGIAKAQDEVMAALAHFNPRSSHRYAYIPYLYLEVDTPALQALLASPLVLEVFDDIAEFPSLDVSVPLIGAPPLWNLYGSGQGFDGTGVAVAVLDTGVDKDHPFLTGAVVSEACYSTNDPASFAQSLCPGGVTHSTSPGSAMPYASGVCPATKCDHGTHVAGIIAGRQGVAVSPPAVLPGGVAPGAHIIAIQVFSLIGGQVAAYQSDIMKGLERVYALRLTYDISSINMSLGGSTLFAWYCDTDPRKPIIDSLKAAGVATVVSAGNNGSCGSLTAPACVSSVVSVGATDDSDAVASYSNRASFMSLFAPGTNINSSLPGGTYANKSGTSMAAPHVSGGWALLKQAKPGATVDQVLASLTSTGQLITDAACPSVMKSRIRLDGTGGALAALGNGPSAETEAATNITQTGATLNGRVNANNAATTVIFEYGTTTAYGSNAVADQSPVNGVALTPVSATIGALTQNTLYHYRVKADDGSVVSYGADMTFSTVGPCAAVADGSFEGGTPSASWSEASVNFGTPLCTVELCGGAGPRTGAWWASFGGAVGAAETASLTQNVVIPAGSVPRLEFYLWNNASSGNGADALNVLVDGAQVFSVLEGNPFYGGGYLLTGLDLSAYADGAAHAVSFQSAAAGASPTVFNLDDVSISCGAATTLPVVTTAAASSVTATAAALNGLVNANNAATSVAFEYGPTTSYGSTVPGVPNTVAGSADTAVNASVTGLTPGTAYHYRVTGASITGRAYGGDMTFSTTCIAGLIRMGASIYTTLQAALDAAATMDTALVEAKAGDFPEDLLFQGAGIVTLKGGYDCAFVSNQGYASLTGSVTVKTGTAVIENVIVR